MTEAEIIEIFIKAAKVDRNLPRAGGPSALKAVNIGIIHTFADQVGWPVENMSASFIPRSRLSTSDVSIWELAMEMIKLVPNAGKRRALWNFAASKAGGRSFSSWCKQVESIQPMTGSWRARSAILHIYRAFNCNALLHNGNEGFSTFAKYPEIGDKSDNISNDAPKSWMAPDAKPMRCDFDADLAEFNLTEQRARMRRQRDQMARKKAA